MKKQLQIRIYPDGKIDAKTIGIQGQRCTDYVQLLEQLLHARTVQSAYTDEYYVVEEHVDDLQKVHRELD